MKFYASTFEEYLNSVAKYNLHPELNEIWDKLPSQSVPPPNMIFYGPSGVGKYSQVLHAIRKYNPRTQKKINIQFNKQIYNYNLSNIHYEIDMALLGCNSKLLWHDIFVQIVDIINVRKQKFGIIVCKNFHTIHNELLEIFYSYMQQYNSSYSSLHISFIIVTDNISFLPLNILNACYIVKIARPTKAQYVKLLEIECSIDETTGLSFIDNWNKTYSNNGNNIITLPHLKELFSIVRNGKINTDISTNKHFYLICNTIIRQIIEYKTISLTEFRDIIYDIFIYNLNVSYCIWYIIFYIIQTQKIDPEVITGILLKSYTFFQYFNNNYRPIYHLESFFIYIIEQLRLNELKNTNSKLT